MANERGDRRVQRTKRLLQRALMSLVAERPFDKITVQDVLDRANVGRTTFYSHFQSKEDLFLSSHAVLIRIISHSFFSDEGTLRTAPSTELVAFLNEVGRQSRDMYFHLTWGSETGEIMRLLKERIAEQLEARLHELFQEEESTVPFAVLAQHVASSIVSLSRWWLDKRTPYTAQELASMLHQMNQAALRQALRVA